MSDFQLMTDLFRVEAPANLCEMSKTQRDYFCDSALDKPDDKKGILVTFGLSNSGKRINNRIYTPKGQRDGLNTWTEPFLKPILMYHKPEQDALGRILSVEYNDTYDLAMPFFRNVRDFNELLSAYDSDEPRRIYKIMQKNGLFLNKKWPGLGQLKATARITDRSAIEKFLDQRYLTFSAGSESDRYACGLCGNDWFRGDICDHPPGSVVDGELAVFITGIFRGKESSVVNGPGNDTSVVLSISFSDSENSAKLKMDDFIIDTDSIYTSSAIVEKPWEDLEPIEIVRNDTESIKQLSDAIGRTHLERSWIIRMHDALHSEYDYSIRWEGVKRIPLDSFRLHGQIHDLSTAENFRGALINGELDSFDSAGQPSKEYISPHVKETEDSMDTSELMKSFEDSLKNLRDELLTAINQKGLIKNKKDFFVDESVNWQLFDKALEGYLREKQVSKLERDALRDEDFLVKGRLVPLGNSDYRDGLLEFLGQAGLTDKQNTSLTAYLKEEQEFVSAIAVQEIVSPKDYENALLQIDSLKEELKTLRNFVEELDSGKATSQNDSQVDTTEKVLPKEVENPSIANSDNAGSSAKKGLGEYEKEVIEQFTKLKDSKGMEAANTYLRKLKRARYLPDTFDINLYIQEAN